MKINLGYIDKINKEIVVQQITQKINEFLGKNSTGSDNTTAITKAQCYYIDKNDHFKDTKFTICTMAYSIIDIVDRLMQFSVGIQFQRNDETFKFKTECSEFGIAGTIKNIKKNYGKGNSVLMCGLKAIGNAIFSTVITLLNVAVGLPVAIISTAINLLMLPFVALCEGIKCLVNKSQQQSPAFGY